MAKELDAGPIIYILYDIVYYIIYKNYSHVNILSKYRSPDTYSNARSSSKQITITTSRRATPSKISAACTSEIKRPLEQAEQNTSVFRPESKFRDKVNFTAFSIYNGDWYCLFFPL
jgi:hypothetical protein